MSTKSIVQLWLVVAVLVFALSGCRVSEKTASGDLEKYNEAGFSFSPPKGTTVTVISDVVLVDAPNAEKAGDYDLGPKWTSSTYELPDFKIAQVKRWTIQAGALANFYGLKTSKPQETTLMGQFALVGELSGPFRTDVNPKGGEAYGKTLMASINETRIFSMTCMGLASRKAETDNLFNSLTAAVQFFDPILPTPVK